MILVNYIDSAFQIHRMACAIDTSLIVWILAYDALDEYSHLAS